MPNNIIISFAKETGKSEKEVEKLWDKAKSIVKKEYSDIDDKSDDFFKLVVGILKTMLNMKESALASITTSTLGGKTDGVADPDSYKFKNKICPDEKIRLRKKLKMKKKLNKKVGFFEQLDKYFDE